MASSHSRELPSTQWHKKGESSTEIFVNDGVDPKESTPSFRFFVTYLVFSLSISSHIVVPPAPPLGGDSSVFDETSHPVEYRRGHTFQARISVSADNGCIKGERLLGSSKRKIGEREPPKKYPTRSTPSVSDENSVFVQKNLQGDSKMENKQPGSEKITADQRVLSFLDGDRLYDQKQMKISSEYWRTKTKCRKNQLFQYLPSNFEKNHFCEKKKQSQISSKVKNQFKDPKKKYFLHTCGLPLTSLRMMQLINFPKKEVSA